ncbi:MAG TPA: pseudouridine synthase, partial [Pirellulales bacterium]|nr:pseudouridine synthase [Pirellulales bacterium]
DDPAGRPRVIDLVPASHERLFTVGRLDLSSEGLMLLTNDGELAQRLAHPRYGVHKTYQAHVAGRPTTETLTKLREGVHLAEGVARVVSVHVRHEHKNSCVLEIVLDEGKNREIRRILARMGHKVMRLRRIALGPLRLKDLAPGDVRRLTGEELHELRGAGSSAAQPKRRRRTKARPLARTATSERAPTSDRELARAHPKPRGSKPAASRRASRDRR